jgi:hypothetical protein
MANELNGTDPDRRIYYERVHALLAVESVTRGKDRAISLDGSKTLHSDPPPVNDA